MYHDPKSQNIVFTSSELLTKVEFVSTDRLVEQVLVKKSNQRVFKQTFRLKIKRLNGQCKLKTARLNAHLRDFLSETGSSNLSV